MPNFSSSELRTRLAEALRSAEGGETVVITRHGKPAAALIAADRLPRRSPPPADQTPASPGDASPGDAAPGDAAPGDAAPGDPDAGTETSAGGGEPTPEQLLERAAAPTRRRIAHDLDRLPKKLKPVLVMIRDNLFQPRLTVKHIKRTLGVGANDLTTRFKAAAGAPIREYLDDRRLECAARLLVDTRLDVETIALLVGHRKREVFARAFQRRYGVRPPVYRESGGRLSRTALETARPGRVPLAPRFLAGWSALASGVPCAHCGRALAPEPMVRVFDDLAPICDHCARQRVPELAGLLEAGGAG